MTFSVSDLKLQITYHNASFKDVQATEEAFSPQIENIQHFKTWNFWFFCASFLPSWIRFPNPETDLLTWLNPDPIRIRIRNTDATGTGTESLEACYVFVF